MSMYVHIYSYIYIYTHSIESCGGLIYLHDLYALQLIRELFSFGSRCTRIEGNLPVTDSLNAGICHIYDGHINIEYMHTTLRIAYIKVHIEVIVISGQKVGKFQSVVRLKYSLACFKNRSGYN